MATSSETAHAASLLESAIVEINQLASTGQSIYD